MVFLMSKLKTISFRFFFKWKAMKNGLQKWSDANKMNRCGRWIHFVTVDFLDWKNRKLKCKNSSRQTKPFNLINIIHGISTIHWPNAKKKKNENAWRKPLFSASRTQWTKKRMSKIALFIYSRWADAKCIQNVNRKRTVWPIN